MSADDRENWCLRCGRCCHEKIRLDDERVLITDVPCEHLDVMTKLCRIYANRSHLVGRCQSAAASAKVGALPGDCPYAMVVKGYPAPLMLADHPEHAELVEELYPGCSRVAAGCRRSR